MQLKEFNILLDIKKHKKNEEIEIVQGDFDTNIINITLYDGLNIYSLDGLNIEIAFAKPDGTTVLQGSQDEETPIVIAGNKIICTLRTNTIAAPGKVLAEVRILDNDRLLTSTRFEFYVRKAIVNDETVESTNEFPILNKKIKEVNDLIEEVQGMEAIKGDDGKSAYEVWIEAGNTGTVEDYLNSLKGEQGPEGPEGKQGPEGPQGKEGPEGKQGPKGEAGTSLKILGSYSTLQELEQTHPDGSVLDGGFMVGENYYYWNPTQNQWENAGPLQGPEGPEGKEGKEGPQGLQGLPGLDGKSLEFTWNGTQLGVRIEGETEYQYVDLKGNTGSDAEVTNANVLNAIGYTPASESMVNAKLNKSGDTLESYREKLLTLTGLTPNIDLSQSNAFKLTLEGATIPAFINPSPSVVHSFTLILIQPATAHAITFPSSVKWGQNGIPDLTKPNKKYYLMFTTTDGGTTWDGMMGDVFDVS